MNSRKKFIYSELSWLKLRTEFLSSKGVPLEQFSFEESGQNYPKLVELLKRAKREKWEYQRASTNVLNNTASIEETSQTLISKELENLQKLTDNLEFVYSTVSFCKDAQLMINNILPDLERSFQGIHWNKLDPLDRISAFEKLVKTFKTLTDIQAHYMGLTNPTAFLESVERFDSNSTLEDVKAEIDKIDDQESVSLISEFLN